MGNENGGTPERVINDPTESEFAVLAIYRAVLDPLIAPNQIQPDAAERLFEVQQQGFG